MIFFLRDERESVLDTDARQTGLLVKAGVLTHGRDSQEGSGDDSEGDTHF